MSCRAARSERLPIMISAYTSLGLSSQAVQQLQHLVRVNLDSRDSYREAIAMLQDWRLKRALQSIADQRDRQARALQSILWSNFEDASPRGSLIAAAHRVWLNLRAAVSETPHAMLREAVRVETYVSQQYVDVIRKIEGRAIRQLLQEQLEAVQVAGRQVLSISNEVTRLSDEVQ